MIAVYQTYSLCYQLIGLPSTHLSMPLDPLNDKLPASVKVLTKIRSSPNENVTSNIIDIRRDAQEYSILDDIKTGLRPADGGQKTLPTLLLYDEAGLKLFEKITYLDEYYLTNAEIEVLKNNATRISERIQPGSLVLELGSG